MKNTLAHLTLLSIVFFSPSTWAKKKKEPQRPREEIVAIDVLQERLFLEKKSKKARVIKKVNEFIKEKKYTQALTSAEEIKGDDLFSDYYYWLTSTAHQKLAEKALDKKKYSDAIENAKKSINQNLKLGANSPYSPFLKNTGLDIAMSELLIGNAQAGLKNWGAARTSYELGFQRLYSRSRLDYIELDNVSNYAKACSKKTDPVQDDLCTAWLNKFIDLYPRNSEEGKAIAKHFPDLIEKAKPAQPAGKTTKKYKAPDLDTVAFNDAFTFYTNENYGKSIDAFRKFLDEYPRSAFRYRAQYWLGRSLEMKKDKEEAKKIYDALQEQSPTSYYGLLASLATGKALDSYIESTLPKARDRDRYLNPQELIRLKRAEYLIVEGANEMAAFELKDLSPRDTLSGHYLMYLANLNYQAKNYLAAFTILSSLIQRKHEGSFSSHALRMVFPVSYITSIEKYAEEHQVDPVLVLSLIKQESAFDPSVSSPVGATGLMQIMFTTAVDTVSDVTLSELLEVNTNINVGTKYLKRLLNRFNGNIVMALAGYNAGPTVADRWYKDKPSKMGMLEFIETIPYQETREYVCSIIRNYFWYSKKLNGEAPKSLSYFWNNETLPDAPPPEPLETLHVKNLPQE